MTVSLVKKDILLAKRQTLFMLVLAAIIPIFVVSRVPTLMGAAAFIYTVIFTEIIILQSIAAEEAKHPKAAALICAAPYSRKSFVIAKYVLFLLLFVYCYIIFNLVSIISPNVGVIELRVVLAVLLCSVTIYGVYLPLHFKYGFEKTKFFFMITLFIIAFGTPMLVPYFGNIDFDFSRINAIPPVALKSALLIASAIILYISMAISIKIFSAKDL